ncbi:MAG TPA: hypothetical protein VL309_09235 [Vicinamibacterales bacterium]|nr:hypothetical protein [Vicinamibacterales bacterium]
MKAGGLTLLWLLCASLAEAAPHHHRRARTRLCDPHARRTLRTIEKTHRQAGPVSAPSTRALAGLADPTLLFQRGHGPIFGDDVVFITTDAPAARIEADARLVPAFEPVGVLGRTVDRLPRTLACSPRSPRGPPSPA